MAKYRVKKEFLENEDMVTTVNGKVVALLKPQHKTIPASENGPAKTIAIPLATQDEMEAMHKDKNPVIEAYEEKEATGTDKK